MIVNDINHSIVHFKLTSVKMVLVAVPYMYMYRDHFICCMKLS